MTKKETTTYLENHKKNSNREKKFSIKKNIKKNNLKKICKNLYNKAFKVNYKPPNIIKVKKNGQRQ